MNKVAMVVGAAGAAMLFAGCEPDLAQVENGSKEAAWQEKFKENYSSYKAPRTAPPAVVDNVSKRLLEEEQMRKSQGDNPGAPEASDDPQVTVDKAADGKPVEVKQNAPASQNADKKVGDDPKAYDNKAADGKKADDKKPADGKKAEAKKAAPASEVKGDVYEVVAGDSLGKISKHFYGDARRYDIILHANPQLKDNPDKLRVGMKLVIPKI